MAEKITRPSSPTPTPPDEYYKFLATVGIESERLEKICIQEVIVTGISDMDMKHVSVEYGGQEFARVPVWIHTDYGTRRRKILDSEAAAPGDYFENSALMFPLPQGEYEVDGWSSLSAYPPVGLALVEGGTPLGIISVVFSMGFSRYSESSGYPNYFNCAPTWKPYLAVEFRERKYTITEGETYGPGYDPIPDPDVTTRFVLFDLLENEIAKIPNAAKTELVLADSDDNPEINDYYSNAYPVIISKGISLNDGYSLPFIDYYEFNGSADFDCAYIPETTGWHFDFDQNTQSPAWLRTSCVSGSPDPPRSPSYLYGEADWYSASTSTLDISEGESYEYINKELFYTGGGLGVHTKVIWDLSDWGPYNEGLSNWLIFTDTGIADKDELYRRKINRYFYLDYDNFNYEIARRVKTVDFNSVFKSSTIPTQNYTEIDTLYTGSISLQIIDKDTGIEKFSFNHDLRDNLSWLYQLELPPFTDEKHKKKLESQSITMKGDDFVVVMEDNFLEKGIMMADAISYSRVEQDRYERYEGGILQESWDNRTILEKSYLNYSYSIKTSGVGIDICARSIAFIDSVISEFELHDDSSNNYFFTYSGSTYGNVIQYIPNYIDIKKLNIVLIAYDIETCELEYSGA